MPYREDLRALYLLRENIGALLAARKESQASLAQYCGHQKAWINKFLNDQDAVQGRGVSIPDLDKIAGFFGLQTFQLFQPGISALTERRSAADRRMGHERRIGHSGRQLAGLRAELNKLPAIASAHGSQTAARPSALPPAIQRIIAEAERQIHAYSVGQQTPTHGPTRAAKSRRHRKSRRSDVETG